ncbi:MAG: hypothetical protein JST93_25790 [Acidobacteria bacterium]|nr:hypothetical protein [Acidobacteriota bacterium]
MIVPFFFMLPVVLLVALVIIAKTFWHSRRVRWMVSGSASAALMTGVIYLAAIFHSTSSTAAIGILFIPMAMGMAAPVGALFGVMAHEIRHEPRSIRGVLSLIVVVGVVGLSALVGWRVVEFQRMKKESDGDVLARAAAAKLPQRDYFLLSAIAANPKTPSGSLLAIATFPDDGLHEKRNGWINMFDRDQLAVVRKVIHNPNAPREALVQLAASKNEYVRGDIAQEHRTPVELLRKLAAEPHGYLVDWGLAWNRSTPVEILERLPYETDATVAQHLGHNPSTPAALLERLAQHEKAVVRGGVAGNRSTPEPALRALTRDKEQWVARQAEWQLQRRR